jgi:molecular chaperone GrpE
MSDKKKHEDKNDEVVKTPNAGEQASPEFDRDAWAEIESLKQKLEDAESKLADSVEGWQRTQADFQNYRRRIERDNEMMFAAMKGDIVKKVLPALDDLERAMQNRPDGDAWANGIDLIVRKFQNILDAEGVKRIEAEGAEFNPSFHEAISHEAAEGVESGHVIAVVQNGYMLGERVIRPALVRVAQ